MKNKTAVIMILFCIMLCLASCDNDLQYLDEDDILENSYGDDNVFDYTESDDNVDKVVQGNLAEGFCKILTQNNEIYFQANSIYRYNTNTGNITSVCTDPICTHNTKECPFFAVSTIGSFYVSDNKIYFTVDNVIREGDPLISGFGYYEYNIDTGHVSVSKAYRSDTNQFFGGILYTDGAQYYYDFYHNEDTDEWKFYICRYTENNKETTIICELEDYATVLIDKIDDLIYYSDGTGIGTIDETSGEKTEIFHSTTKDVSHDDEYFYYRSYTEDNPELHGLYRLKIGSSQSEYLGESNIAYYYLTNNYIYYKHEEDNIIGKDKFGNDIDISSQKIWRMKKDGSDKELVYEFKDELANTNIYYFCVLGNYIYGFYNYYTEDMEPVGSNNSTDAYRATVMRIDVTNGNIYYINVPK